MDPTLIVNFKTYSEATGESALKLAKVCDRVSKVEDADIRIAVQSCDLRMIASEVDIPVYAQHVDAIEPGSHTGWVLAEAVEQAGADGTLLNHSEHTLGMDRLEETIDRVKSLGLDVVVCAKDADVGKSVSKFDPDFVAVEPPELIGGDVSVSSAKPELIERAADKVDGRLLVGAGVKDGDDVKKSLELGAVGILVASGVCKAGDVEEAVKGLVSV